MINEDHEEDSSNLSSSLLNSYEQQYAVLSSDITSHIVKLPASSHDRLKTIAEIEKLIEDAHELMEQMELEVCNVMNSANRSKLSNRVFSYKTELNRLVEEFSKVKHKNTNRRVKELSNDSDDDVYVGYGVDEQRRRLLDEDSCEQLERTGKHLTNGYRIAIETERIGATMLNDLHQQRQTIQSSLHTLHETNTDISLSGRILTGMRNRSVRHKVILYAVAIIFCLICIYAVYSKIF